VPDISIDLVFDTVCPWCYIGKRRLDEALKQRPDKSVMIRWRPFLLNPSMPKEGMPHEIYMTRRFGGPRRAQRAYNAVEDVGLSAEIDFAFDSISRTPCSIDSHRLVLLADRYEKSKQMIEALFYSYFVNGKDIGNVEVLTCIATSIGLNCQVVEDFLASDEDLDTVHESNHLAHSQGINGVPAFIFNEHFIISGGYPSNILARMIDTAFQELELKHETASNC